MSDTPTTAEEVITEAYQAWVVASLRPGIHDDWPAAVVAALRNSPDALADLNGGEWAEALRLIHGALLAIDADHSPDVFDPPTGCVTCYPMEASWPCVTRIAVDEALDALASIFVPSIPREATNG